jgi:hypothetical protein
VIADQRAKSARTQLPPPGSTNERSLWGRLVGEIGGIARLVAGRATGDRCRFTTSTGHPSRSAPAAAAMCGRLYLSQLELLGMIYFILGMRPAAEVLDGR